MYSYKVHQHAQKIIQRTAYTIRKQINILLNLRTKAKTTGSRAMIRSDRMEECHTSVGLFPNLRRVCTGGEM